MKIDRIPFAEAGRPTEQQPGFDWKDRLCCLTPACRGVVAQPRAGRLDLIRLEPVALGRSFFEGWVAVGTLWGRTPVSGELNRHGSS